MGSFQRFGSNPGAAGPFNLIAPTTVDAGNQVLIQDWGGTLGPGGANTMLQLEASIDGILWVEVDRF